MRPSTPDVATHVTMEAGPRVEGDPSPEVARAFNQLRRDSVQEGHAGMVVQKRVPQHSVFGSQAVTLRPESAHGCREQIGRSDAVRGGWAPPAEGTFSLIVPLVLFPGKQVGGQVILSFPSKAAAAISSFCSTARRSAEPSRRMRRCCCDQQAHPPVLSGVGEIQGTFDGAGFQFGSLQVPVQMRTGFSCCFRSRSPRADVADLRFRIPQGNVKFHPAGKPLGIEGPSTAVALPHANAESAAHRRLIEVSLSHSVGTTRPWPSAVVSRGVRHRFHRPLRACAFGGSAGATRGEQSPRTRTHEAGSPAPCSIRAEGRVPAGASVCEMRCHLLVTQVRRNQSLQHELHVTKNMAKKMAAAAMLAERSRKDEEMAAQAPHTHSHACARTHTRTHSI